MNSVFQHEYRVSYADCTVGNHVYYGRYLEILEVARGEFFRAVEQPFLFWQEQGVIFPVVECSLRYLAPARYDERLTIQMTVSDLSRVRLAFFARVCRGEKLLVEARTAHVCTSLEEKPMRLPETLREALSPYRSGPDQS